MAATGNRISNWCSRQWSDVRGNLKYALAYWLVLGSGMTWIVHQLQALLHANIAGWLSLAAPIFSILAVAYLVAINTGRNTGRTANPIPTPEESSTGAPAAIQKVIDAPPRRADLHGEIHEVYIHCGDSAPILPKKVYVLLRAQITNRGQEDTTVTAVGLRAWLGSFDHRGEKVSIPAHWRIQRPKEGFLLVAATTDFEIEPSLIGDNPNTEIYKVPIPREGWIAFEFYIWTEATNFPNVKFDLYLKDSFGVEHVISRPAGVYPITGELITTPKPSAFAGL